jgi:hypothetical protein
VSSLVLRDDGSPTGAIAISPDGARIAFIIEHRGSSAARRARVVVDGTPGLEYERVSDLQFTADGTRLIYAARSGGRRFVILDGTESEAYDMLDGEVVTSQ